MAENGLKIKIKFGLKANLSREWENDPIHSLSELKNILPVFIFIKSEFWCNFQIYFEKQIEIFQANCMNPSSMSFCSIGDWV